MEPERGTWDHGAAAAALHEGRAFEHADIAQLVLDPERRLVLANRKARDLFAITTEDTGKPIQDLNVSYTPVELRSPIDEAETENQPVVLREVDWKLDGAQLYWDVTVAPLSDGDSPLGTMVAFVDVTRYRGLEQELGRSRREVQSALEELQWTVKGLETTNEELQSTVEELETTNEELRARSAQLDRVNALFETLLLGLQTGVIVTDGELRVDVWSSEAENLCGLRSSEVVGRHLLDLEIGLPVHELGGPARACLSGGSQRETLELDALDRSISYDVTILPLVESDDVRGVVILIDARRTPR